MERGLTMNEKQFQDQKIVLIDGHSILNRAFYGLPDLTNAEGLHTNAVYGFLNILFKILEEEKPEYLTVAFDVHAPTFRHEMYKEYKGTRKPMAEELRQQVPVIKEVLKAMGIRLIEQAGLEADDLIGTLSRRCEEAGMQVVVLSGDRDLLQLATKKVKIRIPKTKQGRTEVEDYLEEDVKEKYQVTPKEFIDVKALMGDTSDNIPGVPSIGEKTATKIIVEYQTIENAYAHVDELKPPRAAKALKEHYDLAQMSKELATINVHADFPYEVEEGKVGELFTAEAYEWFQKLEFKNLLGKFEIQAPASEIEDSFVTVTDPAGMDAAPAVRPAEPPEPPPATGRQPFAHILDNDGRLLCGAIRGGVFRPLLHCPQIGLKVSVFVRPQRFSAENFYVFPIFCNFMESGTSACRSSIAFAGKT